MRVRPRVLCLCAALLLPGLAAAQPGGPIPPDLVLASFDVPAAEDLLTVPVSIAGKSYLFAVDTGASLTVYDLSLEAALGQPVNTIKVVTPLGPKEIKRFRAPQAALGNLPLHAADAVVLGSDLSKMRQVSGENIHGVLGMDFLSRHVVRVDFDRGKLYLLKSSAGAPGREVALGVEGLGCTVVAAELPGWGPERFFVDTGHGGLGSGLLKAPLLDALLRQGRLKQVGQMNYSGAAGGEGVSRIGQLEGLALGGLKHDRLQFGEAQDNYLGLGFWSRFEVTFDFPRAVMYLAEGRRFGQPDRMDASGLHLLRVDGRTVVDSVDRGSPAAVAGVRAEDAIVQLGGQDSGQLRLQAIRRLLCAEGRQVQLTLLRGGETIDLRLNLQNWRAAPALTER